jgi:hypothetical protein
MVPGVGYGRQLTAKQTPLQFRIVLASDGAPGILVDVRDRRTTNRAPGAERPGYLGPLGLARAEQRVTGGHLVLVHSPRRDREQAGGSSMDGDPVVSAIDRV